MHFQCSMCLERRAIGATTANRGASVRNSMATVAFCGIIGRKLSVLNTQRIFVRHPLHASLAVGKISTSRRLTAGSWCNQTKLWVLKKNWWLQKIDESWQRFKF